MSTDTPITQLMYLTVTTSNWSTHGVVDAVGSTGGPARDLQFLSSIHDQFMPYIGWYYVTPHNGAKMAKEVALES